MRDRELTPDVRGERTEKRAWIRPKVSVLGAEDTEGKTSYSINEATFGPTQYGPS